LVGVTGFRGLWALKRATVLGGLWALESATVLGGLWALEYAWHSAETNLRCAGGTLLKQTCAAQESQ